MIITHYCRTLDDALKHAKLAGKQHGYEYEWKIFPNGGKGFAVYKHGNLVEKYLVVNKKD